MRVRRQGPSLLAVQVSSLTAELKLRLRVPSPLSQCLDQREGLWCDVVSTPAGCGINQSSLCLEQGCGLWGRATDRALLGLEATETGCMQDSKAGAFCFGHCEISV